jgi:Polyketide cyclase / dehydrase and lipid transport
MTTLIASAERAIPLPAETLFDYVADFREHHPKILPPAFADFTVESGGVGVGTVTRSNFTMGGRTRPLRTAVSRVEPGRLIEEVVLDEPMVTTFSFVPNDGAATVRIETRWEPGGGLSGILERLFAPRLLARIYDDELGRLEAYALARA